MTVEARELAREMRSSAHAPYSDFQVGACVETDQGIFGGANVEFAGRLGIHAEEMAMAKAKIGGSTNYRRIMVSCADQQGRCPCGKCLMIIGEFVDDIPIQLDNGNGWKITTLDQELPNAYRRGGNKSYHD